MRIRDLPVMERPRERMVLLGPEDLTLRELISLVLASGSQKFSALDQSELLLKKFSTLQGLKSAGLSELVGVSGIGQARACRIKAALELAGRLKNESIYSRGTIQTGRDVMEFCLPWFWGGEQEVFLSLALDVKQRVIRLFRIARGSLVSCPVHPREVFRPLIREGAISFVVAHNHPSSGDPEPSQKDLDLTERLVETGKLLGIPLLDHVIAGQGRFVSLKERGLV